MSFAFNPPTGLLDVAAFPTTPANETAGRQQFMTLFNQIRDEINSGANSAIGNLYRQAVINGNFDVWQRGTSFTITDTTTRYTADRWAVFAGAGAPTMTVSRQSFTVGQTEVPNEPTNFIRLNQTVAGSSDNTNIVQRIEDVRTFAGEKVTISFWAKAAAPTVLMVDMVQNFGSGGSAVIGSSNVNANMTTTWQKFVATVTVPSIAGKTIGTNHHIYLRLRVPAHPWTGTIDLAQVQVNVGDIALPFQPRSFAEELALCLRYYEKSHRLSVVPGSAGLEFDGVVALAHTTSQLVLVGGRFFKVKKRIAPTATIYSYNGTNGKVSTLDLTADVGNTLSLPRTSEDGFITIKDSATAFTQGAYYWFAWTADAEL